MTFTFSLKFLDRLQRLFEHHKTPVVAVPAKDPDITSRDLQSVHDCADSVSEALIHLANKDVIGSCRVQHQFGKLKRPRYRLNNDDGSIYMSYLWEGAEKIIETARHISANPNLMVDMELKSEITILAKSITELKCFCRGEQIASIKDMIGKERECVQNTIAGRTKNMRHEHFNDGTLEYSYLSLLYHLHSFLNSAYRLNIFRNNPTTLKR